MTVKDLKNFLKNKPDNCEIKNIDFINTGQDYQDNYSPPWEIEDTGDFILISSILNSKDIKNRG